MLGEGQEGDHHHPLLLLFLLLLHLPLLPETGMEMDFSVSVATSGLVREVEVEEVEVAQAARTPMVDLATMSGIVSR